MLVNDIQIDVFWAKHWVVPPLWRYQRVVRPSTTIWYVQKGTLAYEENQHTAYLNPGTLALLPVEHVSTIWNASDEDLDYLSLGCTILVGNHDLFEFENHIIYDGSLPQYIVECWCDIIELMENAHKIKATVDRLFFTAKVHLLCAYLFEHMNLDPMKGTGRFDHRVQQLLEIIHRDLATNPKLKDIAQELYVSESHLRNLLKKELGLSFRQTLLRVKMRQAKHLLVKSGLSVGEVALKVGYSDHRHFTRAFTLMEGISPSRYQKLAAQLK
ncbi:MAG TPA: AraC family transcriptional regulator [Firmicutes bacterium]|nr:AraC family transcriptional regulator [Bacillota bacterium]